MAIDELNSFFSSVQLPETVNLAQGVKIINVPEFIENHLKVLNIYGDAPEWSVFYDRLVMIKDLLMSDVA